jgi:hypothetical protein
MLLGAATYTRESNEISKLNAFCLVAASVLLSDRAIFAAGVFCRASVFSSRTSSLVHSRRLDRLLAIVVSPIGNAETVTRKKPAHLSRAFFDSGSNKLIRNYKLVKQSFFGVTESRRGTAGFEYLSHALSLTAGSPGPIGVARSLNSSRSRTSPPPTTRHVAIRCNRQTRRITRRVWL